MSENLSAAHSCEVVTGFSVFGLVDAVDFFLFIKAQADGELHDQGQDSRTDRRIEQNRARTDSLTPHRVETATADKTGNPGARLRCGHQADQQGACDTTDEVHTDDV